MGERDTEAIRLREKTVASFGFEWTKFPDVFSEYERSFLDYIAPVDKEFFKGKLVLDAGCGAGRHAFFAARYGARVIAVDSSPGAVAAAARNLRGLRARTLRADICGLPDSWKGRFDCVLCIGVLHHLPDPQAAFLKLVALLKPGGTISVWVYGKKDNLLATHLYEPLRRVTTKLPHEALYPLALIPAILLEAANRLRLPLFEYYAHFPFKTKWNDAFDVFSAPYARYYTIEEVRAWFERAGLEDVQVSYRMLNGKAKGIRGLGRK